MDSPCIKQTVCKVLKIFQHGKFLVAYVLKISILEIYEKRRMNTGIKRKISKKCNCTGFEPTYLDPKDMELSNMLFRN